MASADSEEQRNVWNIVWSCLVTIFACVWIAVHPNIPASKDTWLVVAVRRVGLMVCALVAPEVIILWAMRQWYSARKISEAHAARGWTTTHGFFLQMGGFMLYSGDKPLRPLQLEEMEELHRKGAVDWPSITVEEIEDRSKGDALSKGLVILQTTWFLAQCIIRSVKGFLLTELELVTLAFATLNAVMYFFWWNKPLDIRCHVPVRIKLGLEDGRLSINDPSVARAVVIAEETSILGGGLSGCLGRSFASAIKSTKRMFSNIRHSFRKKDLLVNLLARLHYLAVAFFHIFLRIVNTINGQSPDGNLRVPTFFAAHLIPNSRIFFLMSVACAIIGTVFGAIHCVAWSFTFPSPLEQRLWRISSLVVTFAPICIVFISYYISQQAFPVSSGTYNRPITVVLTWPKDTTLNEINSGAVSNSLADDVIDEDRDFDNVSSHRSVHTLPPTPSLGRLFRALLRVMKRLRQSRNPQTATPMQESPSSSWRLLFAVLARIFYRLLLLAITAIYILARFALIFQAFAALRDLSPRALQDVRWTSYIPHL